MRYSTLAVAALGLVSAPFALADAIDVDVGEDGFVYSPNSVKAAVGDVINFHFYPGDHSVAQSTFDAPCVPSGPNAVWSGFINPAGGAKEASTMFSMTVNSTDPMWIYCAQIGHCQAGMAMVINPVAGSTLAQYKSAAAGTSSKAPASVFGGQLKPNVDDDNNDTTSSSAAPSKTAAASASSAAPSAAATTSSSSSSGGAYGGSSSSGNGAAPQRVGMSLMGLAVFMAFLLK